MLRKPAKVFEKYPAAVRTSALEACARISPLATPADLPDELIDATGIDDGEAVLFAKACESRCHYLASNDKRALRTLALAGPLSRIKSLMGGRIYCLEGVLKALLRDRSPESLALAFAPLLPIDKRLQTILSPALSGSPEDCLAAAESFLAGLASELGPDFFAPLPP